jgi:hypothetical protein
MRGKHNSLKEREVKHFLIKYRLTTGSEEDWRKEVAQFIAALENDPALKGKMSYRAMKNAQGTDYYHLAAVEDEAVSILQGRDFFKQYTDKAELAGGGEVDVVPLSIVAETAHRA